VLQYITFKFYSKICQYRAIIQVHKSCQQWRGRRPVLHRCADPLPLRYGGRCRTFLSDVAVRRCSPSFLMWWSSRVTPSLTHRTKRELGVLVSNWYKVGLFCYQLCGLLGQCLSLMCAYFVVILIILYMYQYSFLKGLFFCSKNSPFLVLLYWN
jgi:hypothetical protein